MPAMKRYKILDIDKANETGIFKLQCPEGCISIDVTKIPRGFSVIDTVEHLIQDGILLQYDI